MPTKTWSGSKNPEELKKKRKRAPDAAPEEGTAPSDAAPPEGPADAPQSSETAPPESSPTASDAPAAAPATDAGSSAPAEEKAPADEPSPVEVAGQMLDDIEKKLLDKVKQASAAGLTIDEATALHNGAVQFFNQAKSLAVQVKADLAVWEVKYAEIRHMEQSVAKAKQHITSHSQRCETEYGAFAKAKGLSEVDFYKILEVLAALNDEQVKKFIALASAPAEASAA